MELLENSVPTKRVAPVNFKKEIGRYLRKWPWFLLSVLLFYTAAKIYLRYAIPQYYTTTTLKLQESNGKSTALSDLKNLGMGVSGDNELQAETTVIISKPILVKVVKNLNLDVTFFSQGKIKELELYKDAVVIGKIIDVNRPDVFYSATYNIKPFGKNSYSLQSETTSENKTQAFGKPLKLSFGTVLIDLKPGFSLSSPIKVVFKNSVSVVGYLEGTVNVSLPENKGLLMDLGLTGPVPQKSEDILNNLSKEYIADGIDDKNLEAENTKKFINDRLEIISNDLSGVENEKEGFKRSNQITDLEGQATLALTNADESTKAAFNYNTQLSLLNSIYAATSSDQFLPSNMGLDSGLETTVAQYNNLILTRNRVLKQATSINPEVIEMNKQIASLKNLIRKNLVESRENVQLQLAQSNAQLNLAKDNINKFPTREKVFRSIERQQTLKEQLYLYLLQKREENAITLAVTAPKAKVINPAYTTGIVKPNNRQIIYGATAVGFLLPLLILVGFNMLDTRVHNKDNITSVLPESTVIGEIPIIFEKNPTVHANDFSVFAESFRILTSNLRFILKANNVEKGGIILVTSSVKAEGKTTISVNTALTLAGKNKVILIGADIRNPQLHRFVDGENFGLTDFLIAGDLTPEKFIRKSGININLDIMFSGKIAPNPNDLLDMPKFNQLITGLKETYDYIILDSAPVMLVSDTLNLVENADTILYVVKSDFTEREMLNFAADFKHENNIKSLAFVLNSVKPQNTKYGTKYGYGYNSNANHANKPWWKRIF